jgi:hypothetical protein
MSSKNVRFSEYVTIHPIQQWSSEMPPQDKARVYYSADELKVFRSETMKVRSMVIKLAQVLSKSNPAVSYINHVCLILETHVSVRGFETRLSPTRIRNQTMVMNAVHTYQKQLRVRSLLPRQREIALAEAYSCLNRSSTLQALETARRDEIRAYHCHEAGDGIMGLVTRFTSKRAC